MTSSTQWRASIPYIDGQYAQDQEIVLKMQVAALQLLLDRQDERLRFIRDVVANRDISEVEAFGWIDVALAEHPVFLADREKYRTKYEPF